jgi:hypothetical protein
LLENIFFSGNPETIEGFEVWVQHEKLENKTS